MLPPIPTLVTCPRCSQRFTLYESESGNTFGAIFWTDGWIDAPMLPPDCDVVVCPNCRQPVWADDCRSAETDRVADDDEYGWQDSGRARNPYERCEGFETAEEATLDHWKSLLQPLPEDPRRERYLRTRIWWRMNDQRRITDAVIPLDPDEVGNMITLAAMLVESKTSDLVTKAEIMRELGRFQLAAKLIRRVRKKSAPPETAFIRGLIEQGDARVRQMDPPDRGAIHIYV